uniref:Uncharacterized protein n=1 Tax=Arundo donax TaxID=35708 RepID=A0A0A9ALA7_ARUDO
MRCPHKHIAFGISMLKLCVICNSMPAQTCGVWYQHAKILCVWTDAAL